MQRKQQQDVPAVTSVKNAKAFRTTAIMHCASGLALVVLGATAIGVKARFSYIAVPVWGGLLFSVGGGIVGLMAYNRGPSTSWFNAYLGLNIASLLASASCVGICIAACTQEYYDNYCMPLRHVEYCPVPVGGRKTVDALLVINAAFELSVSIVAMVATSYRLPWCLDCFGPYAELNATEAMTVGKAQSAVPVYIGGKQGPAGTPIQFFLFPTSGSIPGQITAPNGQPMSVLPPYPFQEDERVTEVGEEKMALSS